MTANEFKTLTSSKTPTHKIVNKNTGIHHVSAEGKENADAVAKFMSEYHNTEFVVMEA